MAGLPFFVEVGIELIDLFLTGHIVQVIDRLDRIQDVLFIALHFFGSFEDCEVVGGGQVFMVPRFSFLVFVPKSGLFG